MNANELRIGNYVHRQSGKMVVNRDDVYKIENINLQSALKYEPIPLTEECLLKFGFIKYGHILKIHLNEGLGVNYNKDLKIWYLDIHFTTTAKIQINYVHQLQNLYFALTGEELTLK